MRGSESGPGTYTLCVRDDDIVRHYRIRKADTGGFYIVPRAMFASLKELVRHYQKHSDGLCCRLTVSCPKDIILLRDAWEIPRSSFRLGKRLEGGEFYEAYEGIWNGTTPIAVKAQKMGTMSREEFLVEAEIMKKLRHPHLIQLYACCTRQKPVYIVTEPMRNGSLLDYLQKGEGRHLKLPGLINIGAQVANGM